MSGNDDLTDVEWSAEVTRQQVLRSGPGQQDALNRAYQHALGREAGDPWVQPTGALDAYPLGAQVAHDGKTWISLVGGNVWEPGTSGWREAGIEWPEWVQPTGAHDAYDLGAQVTYQGSRWVSILAANVWVPGQAGWEPAA